MHQHDILCYMVKKVIIVTVKYCKTKCFKIKNTVFRREKNTVLLFTV